MLQKKTSMRDVEGSPFRPTQGELERITFAKLRKLRFLRTIGESFRLR